MFPMMHLELGLPVLFLNEFFDSAMEQTVKVIDMSIAEANAGWVGSL